MPAQFLCLKQDVVTLHNYCCTHCPHMHGLIKGQVSHTPSFYSPCLLCIQGDKIHKIETLTSLCKGKNETSTLKKPLGRKKWLSVPQMYRFTSRAILATSLKVISH